MYARACVCEGVCVGVHVYVSVHLSVQYVRVFVHVFVCIECVYMNVCVHLSMCYHLFLSHTVGLACRVQRAREMTAWVSSSDEANVMTSSHCTAR